MVRTNYIVIEMSKWVLVIFLALILTSVSVFGENSIKVSHSTDIDVDDSGIDISHSTNVDVDNNISHSNISECSTDSDCGWCGFSCSVWERNQICPAVMPPGGYECGCVDQRCSKQRRIIIINITEPVVTPLPVNMTIGNITDNVTLRHTHRYRIRTGNMTITINRTGSDSDEIVNDISIANRVISIHIETHRMRVRTELEGNVNETEDIPASMDPVVNASISASHGFGKTSVDITLNLTDNTTVINAGENAYTTEVLDIEDGVIYVKTPKFRKEIKVLPEQASETAKLRANYHVLKGIELTSTDDSIVYQVKGKQIGKLLWIFSMEIEKEIDIDAETGQVRAVRAPWWSFLVF